MKTFLIALFSFTTLLFPYIHCIDLDQYDIPDTEEARKQLFKYLEEETRTDFQNQCITEGGVGSEFSMQVTQFVKTCAEYSGSKKGYLKFQFICDYCTSDRVTNLIEKNKKECNEACMESIAYCQSPDLIYEGGWGRILYISTRVI